MFDVDWSDPNRESVGDRRARKKKERQDDDNNNGQGDDQEGGSSRTSGSIRSSMSSVEKQFGFFGAKNRKTVSSSRKGKAKSTASSSLRSPTIEEQPQDEHTSAREESPSLPLTLNPFSTFTTFALSRLDGSEHSPGGSLLGCDITNPQPGLLTLYQELGDGVSMITKTIDTTSRTRLEEDTSFLVSKVTIFAGDYSPSLSQVPSFPKLPSNPTFKSLYKSGPLKDQPQFMEVVHPLPTTPDLSSLNQPVSDEAHHLPIIEEDEKVNHGDIPRQKHNHHFRSKLTAPPITPATQRPTDNPDTWKAPNDWEISPAEGTITQPSREPDVRNGTYETNALTLDLAHMQREIDQMRHASPQVILGRLKDRWGEYKPITIQQLDLSDDEDGDAMALDSALVYREREMERKRWLLSVIYNAEAMLDSGGQLSQPTVKLSVQKILSLFESQATTSFLAAANNSTPVYHFSPDPLPHKLYPNIHPMVCPTISPSTLGFAPNSFSLISCLSITSIIPSADIPKLLGSIHRALVPGGCLRMLIVDPWPITDSMGPNLQAWLDENLVFNLELQFRCNHPSRMFPIWLRDAKLRANGSIITTTRFQAIPQGQNDDSDASTRTRDSSEGELAIRKELRGTVGRMLWQEIWGPFVTAEKWWWEVPKIVEECVERETHWEYSIIAACKSGEEAG